MSRGKTLPEFVHLRTALPAPPPSRKVGKEPLPNPVPRPLAVFEEAPVPPAPLPEEAFLESETFGLARLRGLGMQEHMFCVVVPTWNRAATLKRALYSLLLQRYPRWVALVLDDGSTDGTSELVHGFMKDDPRIHYVRYPRNRGGVAMNERGMSLAIETASWWSRLGSDDWWGVSKLDHDAIALGTCPFDACYGSYRIHKDGVLSGNFNKSHASIETRNALLAGRFGVSWANVACTTDVLRRVKERYGRFAHPDLWNMEDFLVNARIARFTDWVWRGVVGGKLVVNPKEEGLVSDELEAFWNDSLLGASGNERQRDRDFARTLEIIAHD
jgi:glycosyltransferase involved in cell wall biosynthesis